MDRPICFTYEEDVLSTGIYFKRSNQIPLFTHDIGGEIVCLEPKPTKSWSVYPQNPGINIVYANKIVQMGSGKDLRLMLLNEQSPGVVLIKIDTMDTDHPSFDGIIEPEERTDTLIEKVKTEVFLKGVSTYTRYQKKRIIGLYGLNEGAKMNFTTNSGIEKVIVVEAGKPSIYDKENWAVWTLLRAHLGETLGERE